MERPNSNAEVVENKPNKTDVGDEDTSHASIEQGDGQDGTVVVAEKKEEELVLKPQEVSPIKEEGKKTHIYIIHVHVCEEKKVYE